MRIGTIAAGCAAALTLLGALPDRAAAFSQEQTLLPAYANQLQIDMTGDENAVTISQTFQAGGGPNRISVELIGNLNGGSGGLWGSPLFQASGLAVGTIRQIGADNALALRVIGDSNLFAVSQTGRGNNITGVIEGIANQVAVSQMGWGNSVAFSQTGSGNLLMVSQTSY